MKRLILTTWIVLSGIIASAQNWNFSLTAIDETCFNAGDGSIDITMSGTTSGFTFDWEVFDDSDISQGDGTVGNTSPDIFEFLEDGDYTVEVTKRGTTESRIKSVTVGGSTSSLTVTKTITEFNKCDGDAAGALEAVASGGAGSYQYGLSFGTGQTSPNLYNYTDNGGEFTSLSAGTYKVFAQDERGCVASTAEFTLTAPSGITIQYDTINANCSNAGGQIEITSISGGTPFGAGAAGAFNYEQKWYDGDAADDSAELTDFENEGTMTGLDSGTYTVVITDANGCTGSTQFTIFSGFNLEQNGLSNVSCAAEQDGEITVRLDTDSDDDEDPFELRIYDGDGIEITSKQKTGLSTGDHTFTGLGPDTYTIIAEGATGCEREIEVELTEPDAPQVDDSEMTPVVCRGDSDGSILLTVSGGSGSYRASSDGGSSYPWNSNGDNEINITGLAAGTYDLFIQDESNCPIDVADVTVTQPAKQWALSEVSRADVTCNAAANGQYSFEFDTSLDTDPVVEDENIVWKDVDSGETVATGVFEKDDLPEGSYRIEVTANSGCHRELTFDISEPAELEILGDAPVFNCPLTLSSTAAEIDASVTGGNGGYSYTWTKNGGALTSETATDALLENIEENAEYTLEVEDSKGCTKTRTFTVEIPDEIEISVDSKVDVACRGEASGSISITVTGGTPQSDDSYIYYWEKDASGTQYSNSEDLTDLEAGTYEITVTDDNACTAATVSYTITEPASAYTLSGEVTPVICNGENNGEIDITIDRDITSTTHPNPTSIEWTKDGEAFASDVIDLTDLEPGTYVLTTNDKYGCEKSATFEIEEYPTLRINPTVTDNTCDGYLDGKIVVNPVGGYLGTNAGYTIRWYKDGTVQGIINDDTEYDDLPDATYRVVVSDSLGCTKDTTIVIDAPDPVSAVDVVTNIKCKGDDDGVIALDITGGTEPYTILWKENDTNGASISTNDTITDLAPGDYYVTITDANSCEQIAGDGFSYENTYTVTEPATEYSIVINATDITCIDENDGELELVITADAGHPSDYSYKWYRNDVELSSSGATITGLDSAQYKVEVTDENGCMRTSTYDLQDPEQLYFNPEVIGVTCNGYNDGEIVLDPTGGYGSFSATWVKDQTTTLTGTNLSQSNLSAGRYDITLSDAGGCEIDTTIFIDDPAAIIANTNITNPSCVDGTDGAIALNISNGTEPYSIKWLINDQLFSTEQNISELSAGTYQLIVSDQFSCSTDTLEVIVSDPPSDFTIEGTIDKITCRDALDGTIDIDIVITGEPDLDYDVYWEKDGELFSQNTEDLTGIGFGSYELFVEDQYGCVKSETFIIENPEELGLNFAIQDVSCYLETDGEIAVQVTGGYGSYEYEWLKDDEPFDVTASFATGLEAAFYEIRVTDSEGCSVSRTVQVEQPDPFLIEVSSVDNTCATPFDSELNATVTGGVEPYKLQWFKDGLPYSKEEDLKGIPAGTYYMMATDTNFCETVSAEVVVTTPVPLGLEVITMENNLCPNTQNGSISFQGTGGSFPYTYSFDSAAFGSVNNFFNLAGREYLVTVRDNVGCTYDTLITIDNEYELEPEFSIETEEFAIDFPIMLTDESLGEGLVQWFWDFGDTRASEDQNTEVTYTSPGKYALTLTVENEVGCRLSKTDTLIIEQGYNFTLPTAFTPNNDGINESFRPAFQNIESLDIKVQDRNGVIVYQSDKLSAFWDGTFNGSDAPQGVYYFEATFTAKSGKVRKQAGKIFLMR